ncbi:MAG: hypothetical protein K2X69_02185 [Silvanigrellaceae bacterium]|nr:hypothetical protein [Silvanigrellaceae bacterium]
MSEIITKIIDLLKQIFLVKSIILEDIYSNKNTVNLSDIKEMRERKKGKLFKDPDKYKGFYSHLSKAEQEYHSKANTEDSTWNKDDCTAIEIKGRNELLVKCSITKIHLKICFCHLVKIFLVIILIAIALFVIINFSD